MERGGINSLVRRLLALADAIVSADTEDVTAVDLAAVFLADGIGVGICVLVAFQLANSTRRRRDRDRSRRSIGGRSSDGRERKGGADEREGEEGLHDCSKENLRKSGRKEL